jgi:hypothetical protein
MITTPASQPNVKNGQPPLDITRPFMDDKPLSISVTNPDDDHNGTERRSIGML